MRIVSVTRHAPSPVQSQTTAVYTSLLSVRVVSTQSVAVTEHQPQLRPTCCKSSKSLESTVLTKLLT